MDYEHTGSDLLSLTVFDCSCMKSSEQNEWCAIDPILRVCSFFILYTFNLFSYVAIATPFTSLQTVQWDKK